MATNSLARNFFNSLFNDYKPTLSVWQNGFGGGSSWESAEDGLLVIPPYFKLTQSMSHPAFLDTLSKKSDCQTVIRPRDLLLQTLELDKKKSNIQSKQHTFVYGDICKGEGEEGC